MRFFYAPGPRAVAKRYVGVSLLRYAWIFLLTFDFVRPLPVLVPIQWQLPGNVWNSVVMYPDRFGGLFGAFVNLALLFVQAGLLVGLIASGLMLLLKPERNVAAAIVDGSRLSRPWWVMALAMSAAVVVTLYLLGAFCITLFNGRSYPISRGLPVFAVGVWPWIVGLALAAFGTVWGFLSLRRVGKASTAGLGVKYLPADHPLTQRVHHYARQLGLPLPAVGWMKAVNAYAVGSSREGAAVIIGLPLVQNLTLEELDAVICHELGHIVSGDMRRSIFAEGFQTFFSGLFGVIGSLVTVGVSAAVKKPTDAQLAEATGKGITMFGRWVLFTAGELMVKAQSRSREFYADAVGAALTSPAAMKGALEKLPTIPADPVPAEREYGYLMFKGFSSGRLFATHPSFERRLAALDKRTHLDALPLKAGV